MKNKASSIKVMCPFCQIQLSPVVTVCKGCGAERRDDELSQIGWFIIFICIGTALMVGAISQSLIWFVLSFLVLFAVFGIFCRSMMFVSKLEWRVGRKKKGQGLRPL